MTKLVGCDNHKTYFNLVHVNTSKSFFFFIHFKKQQDTDLRVSGRASSAKRKDTDFDIHHKFQLPFIRSKYWLNAILFFNKINISCHSACCMSADCE